MDGALIAMGIACGLVVLSGIMLIRVDGFPSQTECKDEDLLLMAAVFVCVL